MNKGLDPRFDQTFAAIYGDRWVGLRAALGQAKQKKVLINPWFSHNKPTLQFGSMSLSSFTSDGFEDYLLDPASVWAASLLDAQPGDAVLDLCAAPGGKSLSLLFATRALIKLTAVDSSATRAQRMKSIFKQQLPKDLEFLPEVFVLDGAKVGQRWPLQFDRVLVDAPCSGERHQLQKAGKSQSSWSPKGVQRLQARQTALICSGFDALKPGGQMVYSTCSIHPKENDEVVAKLLKKRLDAVLVERKSLCEAPRQSQCEPEPTAQGQIFLPDIAPHFGPIFAAVIRKRD